MVNGYAMVKIFWNMFIHFDRIHERDKQTDRQTPCDGIGCAYAQSHTVEFYLYPTVGTVLIHSVKPELTE